MGGEYRPPVHALPPGTAGLVRNDSLVTIPSKISCVTITDHPSTNCQRRLAADTERICIGGEHRPPVHALPPGAAGLARNDRGVS